MSPVLAPGSFRFLFVFFLPSVLTAGCCCFFFFASTSTFFFCCLFFRGVGGRDAAAVVVVVVVVDRASSALSNTMSGSTSWSLFFFFFFFNCFFFCFFFFCDTRGASSDSNSDSDSEAGVGGATFLRAFAANTCGFGVASSASCTAAARLWQTCRALARFLSPCFGMSICARTMRRVTATSNCGKPHGHKAGDFCPESRGLPG